MALDGTYAGLLAIIGDTLNRTELVGVFPDWIKSAEAQLNRRVRCSEMITSTTLSVSTTATALPSDFNGMVSFELPPGNDPLRYDKPEAVRALRQSVYTGTGTPKVWSVIGGNIETAPAPSGTFVCQLLYYGRIPGLTSSNTTNWLITKHPDAYLYGALLFSAPYLKDDARLGSWGALYEAAINDINANDARVSFGHALVPPYRGAAYPQGTDAQPSAIPALPGPG